ETPIQTEQVIDQLLPARAKCALNEIGEWLCVTHVWFPVEPDDRRVDLWPGRKSPGRHPKAEGDRRIILDQYRERAVFGRPRFCNQPVCHFFLDHNRDIQYMRSMFDEPLKQGSGDVIMQISNQVKR